MTRSHIIAAAIVVVGALTALVITVLVIMFYQPGRQPHAVAVADDTAVRISVEPARIQGYVSKLAPGISKFVPGVPKVTSLQPRAFRVDWIHALPYELALLFSVPENDAIATTFFVNPLPESSFLNEFNRWSALREIRGVTWQRGTVSEATEEYATASGKVAVNGNWNSDVPLLTIGGLGIPDVEGGHLLEVSAANAGGAFSQLHAAMDRAWGQPGTPKAAQALAIALPSLRRLHITGDLTEDDNLSFTITLELSDPEARDAVDAAMGAVADAMAASFSQRWGWRFGGGYGWTGPASLEGNYTLQGFEDRLRRALGG